MRSASLLTKSPERCTSVLIQRHTVAGARRHRPRMRSARHMVWSMLMFASFSTSCGTAAKPGAAIVGRLVVQGSKQLWRVSAKVLQSRAAGVLALRNGRLAFTEAAASEAALAAREAAALEAAASEGVTTSAAARQATAEEVASVRALTAAQLAKTPIPNPANLRLIMRVSSGASKLATRLVDETPVEALLLYDSEGLPIVYANHIEHTAVYEAATRAFRSESARVADQISSSIEAVTIGSEAELPSVIASAIQKYLKSSGRAYVLDSSTGKLTINVSFDSGSEIVGTLDIYTLVQRSVVLGTTAAGGYVVKTLKG
jgi:hypothetical protein